MANLGSDNTPVSGELFGLPSGWTLTENNDGEAVFEDSGGNVVLRRDATDGEWVTDTVNADSIDVDSLNNADTSAAAENEVLRKGPSGTDLFFSGIDAGVDYQFKEFTASTTWSKPTDATWVLLDMVSGGGGGGADCSACGRIANHASSSSTARSPWSAMVRSSSSSNRASARSCGVFFRSGGSSIKTSFPAPGLPGPGGL